jgi:cysteinyl-tRNA synthetase
LLKLYNTLSKKKESFKSIKPDEVNMYVCGMTVYDHCHMGHARVLVVFDLIVRHLRQQFKTVNYVRNITDIDDKIIKRALENKEDFQTLTKRFIGAMHEDEKALGVLPPDVEPKATDYIEQMLTMIKTLEDKDYAYKADNGDVYFSVRNFAEYGKLSGRQVDELQAGNRVEIDNYKRDPLDFVLWKSAKPDEPKWNSPWGEGRPGWHIECSAMSNELLGHKFDIHGGGFDLTFPHHENEIAQSEGANGCQFVNYWLHVGFIKINDEKMSKSLDNFFTIREVLKTYSGEVLRFFLISTHYRSPINFSDHNLNNAKVAITRLYTAVRDLEVSEAAMNEIVINDNYEQKFMDALDDDFNTPMAIAVLFELSKEINLQRNQDLDRARGLAQHLKKLANYIGLLEQDVDVFFTQGVELSDEIIAQKIAQRNQARKDKNFVLSDEIRDELVDKGIVLEDKANETTWRRLN